MSLAPLETEAAGGFSHHSRLLFGDFEVDLDRGGLARRGEQIPLRPKTFAVLRYLIERAGTLVSRNELLDAVWPGVVVTGDSVAQCLKEIRRALGDDGRTMIRTVPRRGLIFDVPVRVGDAGRPPTPESMPRNSPPAWRLVVALAALAAVLWWSVDAWRPTVDPRMASAEGTAVNHRPHPEAYRLVLQGQALYRQRAEGDMQAARDLFRRATAIDPDYALAWARLAAASRILFSAGEIDYEELIRTGLAAAKRALELRPDLAEVQFRAADYAAIAGDYETAQAYYERARLIDPENPLVLGRSIGVALYSGNLSLAVEMATQAVQRDPLAPFERHLLVTALFFIGQFDAMRAHAAVAVRLHPDGAPALSHFLLQAALVEEDYPEALSLLDELKPGLSREHALALMAGRGLEVAGAAAALGRLEARESVEAIYRLAEAQAWSGDADAAFESLARARDAFDADITKIPAYAPILESRISPFLVPLHGDPRWDTWLAGLPLQDIYNPPVSGADRRVAHEGYY